MALPQHHHPHFTRLAVTATVTFCILVVSACSVRPTGNDVPASSNDGLSVELGDVRLSNVLVLTASRGQPGTVLGAIDNDAAEPAEVSIGLAAGDAATTVPVEPGEVVLLGPRDESVPIPAVPARPGATVDLDIVSPGHGSTTVSVPVLDDTFPRYADLVPEPTADARSTAAETPLATPTSAPATTGTGDLPSGNSLHAPAPGTQVVGPDVRVEGEATAFEGNLRWQTISDETGQIVASGYTTGGANGTLGPFSFTVELAPGPYTIEIWEPAMSEDGAAGGHSPGPRGLMTTTFEVV